MKRVCKPNGILFIGDIPTDKTYKGFEHQPYNKKDYSGWKISRGYHDKKRFNITRKNEKL